MYFVYFCYRMSSSDNDSEEKLPMLYAFALVKFVHRGRKRKLEEIDIVPKKWITFDLDLNRFVTKYAPADSNQEDYQVLQDLVRMLADPPKPYTSYSIDIKGRAGQFIYKS